MSLPGLDAVTAFSSRARATRTRPSLADVHALHDQLAEGELAILHELVWQTAPSPALAKAFPRTRPIEGFEMQVEHAGFEILERVDAADLDAWLSAQGLTNERGAARVCVWLVRRKG